MRAYYDGRMYEPVTPQADNDTLAQRGDRLVFLHEVQRESRLLIVPKGELNAGWVLGVFYA